MTKYVKNILLVAVAVLTCTVSVSAQVYNVRVGEGCRDLNPLLLSKGLYLGMYDGLFCFVGDGEDDRQAVVLLDSNLVAQRSLLLPESSRWCDILTGVMADGRVSLMLVDSASEGQTLLYTSVVDLATMRPVDDLPVMVMTDSITYGMEDHCYVWGSVSKSGEYVGCVIVVEYTSRHQYSARVTMYNNGMETIWSRDYAVGSMEHLAVTDDGRIVSIGYENEEGETHFIFNVIGERLGDTYDAVVPGYPVRQLELAGIVGGKIMGVGLIMPVWNGSNYEELSGGVVGLAFDYDSASLTGISMRPFGNEDLNILNNEKTKKVQRWQEVDLASVSGVTTTPFGAVVAIGRNWRADIVQDNGISTRTHTRMGLNLVAVDTLGNIRWVRNLRRYDIQRDDDWMLSTGLFAVGDTVAVVKVEHPRTPVVYDISRNVKPLILGSKVNTALYTIAGNGDVSKVLLEQRKNYGLLRSVLRSDGSILLFTYNGKEARLEEFTRP